MENYAQAESESVTIQTYAMTATDVAGEVKSDSSDSSDTDDDEALCEAGAFYQASAPLPQRTAPLSRTSDNEFSEIKEGPPGRIYYIYPY